MSKPTFLLLGKLGAFSISAEWDNEPVPMSHSNYE